MAEMMKSFSEASSGGASGQKVASEAKEVASNVADQARQMVTSTVTRRTERSAQDISQVARALRQSKDQLAGNFAAPYVDRAADQLDRLASYVRDADARDMVRGVERFARREPLLFLGGAFALGMLGARFLKSSAQELGSEMEGRRSRPYPLGGQEYPRIGAPGTTPRSTPDYGASSIGGSPYTPTTGPRGVVEERISPTSVRAGAGTLAPDPRGDYPPNEPGQGPFPGGGAGGNVAREGRGRST